VSPALLECIRLTNKISQNLHAELLLRTAGQVKAGLGTTDAGLWLEQDFLKTAGIREGDAVLVDGSGLSQNNLVTPRAITDLLLYAFRQPWGTDFLSTLPIAGVDGTLENRMKGTAAAGRVWAKTGTLEHEHSIAGYATTPRGEHLVFAIFGNNNPQRGHDATAPLDEIAVAMVETLGTPPARKKKK
jgi:D-alanyl-D-alanine carboxypeptidase/D-alanyl-D-alanine-endopeptidase (penicillin-binding protein 4)